jgi:hypothetical protein
MKTRDMAWIIFLSTSIVFGLDLLTNSINTQKNAWDFLYYLAMARDGFHAQPMASPFAYRYLTPLSVNGISRIFGLSIENGFLVLAYFGGIVQLTGVFHFTNWLTKSRKGAYLAMLVTALSLFNVKFLLFDIYRPDHLAYALILLQTYFAFEKKFLPLLAITIVASQIREFNIVPLIAYLIVSWNSEERSMVIRHIFFSALLLLPAIILPRLLIPVTENYQIVGLSQNGILTALFLPLMPAVDINFIFSLFAYLLPLLFLADIKTIKAALANLPTNQRQYLYAYTVLVMVLSFFGGTDFFRFATFLFLPQIILIGLIAPAISNLRIGLMLASMFIFNRIWMYFPDWDVEKYRDFYGGFSLRLNLSTFLRILECGLFLMLGYGLRERQRKGGATTSSIQSL